MAQDIYVFLDNSFLFIEGYKYVRAATHIPPSKTPYVDYYALRRYLQKEGNLCRTVIAGAELPGSMITKCQAAGFEVFTFPRYPDLKTGKMKEKGIDHKICWEIAKTIFTNREAVQNKKIILCTGDKDFMAVLPDIHTANWAFELWLWPDSYSPKFADQVKVFGKLKSLDKDWREFIKVGDTAKAGDATGYKA
jgi:hypothetical protein